MEINPSEASNNERVYFLAIMKSEEYFVTPVKYRHESVESLSVQSKIRMRMRCSPFLRSKEMEKNVKCFFNVIRIGRKLAKPLSTPLPRKANPIRSFQYVYNPLIARLSKHNLKLSSTPLSNPLSFAFASSIHRPSRILLLNQTSFCGS